MKTDIIFRAERRKKTEVTAVFPALCGTNQHDMTCYAHVGQHSSCRMAWYCSTRPATYAEYSALLFELQGIYTDGLNVVQRITPQHRAARAEAMKQMRDL